MKKDVWILCNSREELARAQRCVNEGGGLRAICLLSMEAIYKALERAQELKEMPSLLLADYESGLQDDFAGVHFLLEHRAFIGVPFFFMAENVTREIEEICYGLGATVVISKPISSISMLRIERASMQHEITKNYEKVLQKQAVELSAAKEIQRLNKQLASRNELLFKVLGKYFSDEVVEVILEQPEGSLVGGEKRPVVVMMADLRGFTALSERLSADAVVSILNHYLERMTEVIMKYGGTIIEFIGDAILAVFGAPLKAEHVADDAIAAALEMQNGMEDMNRFNEEQGYPDIEMGIGLHAGEVFIGNIGSERFMRYNVIGQAVNLCSRIQTYSVGGQILVSEQTIQQLSGKCVTGNRFEISMKGIHEPQMVCDIRGIEGIYNVRLCEQKEDSVTDLEQPLDAVLYLMQGKSVIKASMSGRIKAISRHRIFVEAAKECMHEFLLYQDMEIVVGAENAYAKIVGIDEEILELYFTFLSEGFIHEILQRN